MRKRWYIGYIEKSFFFGSFLSLIICLLFRSNLAPPIITNRSTSLANVRVGKRATESLHFLLSNFRCKCKVNVVILWLYSIIINQI